MRASGWQVRRLIAAGPTVKVLKLRIASLFSKKKRVEGGVQGGGREGGRGWGRDQPDYFTSPRGF